MAEPPIAAALDVNVEVTHLRTALMREVPSVIPGKSEHEQRWINQAKAAIAASGPTIDRPLFLVVVDRNPDVQQMRIVLARPNGAWESLGGSKASTGQTGRRDYYLTPIGVFLHTDAILTGGFYNLLQDLHQDSRLALKLLGLGLKLLSPTEEFGQFDHVEGSPLFNDRVQDFVRRALPRQCLNDLSDLRLVGGGAIKLVTRSQCDPDIAVLVEVSTMLMVIGHSPGVTIVVARGTEFAH
jgi:hypothetical protein